MYEPGMGSNPLRVRWDWGGVAPKVNSCRARLAPLLAEGRQGRGGAMGLGLGKRGDESHMPMVLLRSITTMLLRHGWPHTTRESGGKPRSRAMPPAVNVRDSTQECRIKFRHGKYPPFKTPQLPFHFSRPEGENNSQQQHFLSGSPTVATDSTFLADHGNNSQG